jgi:antitoxin MazE
MHTHITKWGNSLGIRIPKYLTQSLHLKEGMPISINRENDYLVIRRKYSLQALLDQVTKDNIHEETLTGKIVGKEIW